MIVQFLLEQWLLVAGLAICLVLLFFHESRRGGRSVTPHQLVALVNGQQAAVIDLREPAEFRKGHIVDAINLPFAKLEERWTELESRSDHPIIFVDRMGQHASAAGKRAAAKGLKQVYRLGGGIMEWQNAQLPLVKE
ncbi:MAG: rhodanese-like domain-containing protein [Spongiibacteraceae bacterium]|jgi:rhodanese-related sulfurtransferase|nr:rhodanese-like domain-containing protein [Spongiibacteraceae bacterium]